MDKLCFILLLPFLGTTLGAAGVFVPGLGRKDGISLFLTGFAAGVMVAASIWSLILPAIEQSAGSCLPPLLGIWAGFLFLMGLDRGIPHLHRGIKAPEDRCSSLSNTAMLTLSVTLHNLPEGMAVGVAAAEWLLKDGSMSFPALVALAGGIALQNIPEGAIISMPLQAEGMKKGKAFVTGVLSGAIEPVAAFLTVLLSALVIPVLPCCLCFAAGAMLYVVVEDLIPETATGSHRHTGVMAFAAGFTLMMGLDVALG